MTQGSHGSAGRAVVLVGVLLVAGGAPLVHGAPPDAAEGMAGVLAPQGPLRWDLAGAGPPAPAAPGLGPEGEPGADANIPKWPDENTKGWTTKSGAMDAWKKDTDGTQPSFDIDMGDFANKDQVKNDKGGYQLLLFFDIQGFFFVDGDGKFDSYLDPGHDGSGDEPCHDGRFDLFTVYVNGNKVHTAQGENERPCNTEGNRNFDLVPMTQGEAVNIYRVKSSWVEKGKNTVSITIHDTGYKHPRAPKFSDGWHMYLHHAQMELVAPPLFISRGWSFDLPPGGHAAEDSKWEGSLASKIREKNSRNFGQDPWNWVQDQKVAPAPANGCAGATSAPPFYAAELLGSKGAYWFALDGKQDFRVSGCQAAELIRGLGSAVGYAYTGGKDPQGFWYVGFSMGGLIGRWAIQRAGLDQSMSKYVSLGTPHLGSHWGDAYTFLVDIKGRYRDRNGDILAQGLTGWKAWYLESVQARYYENNKLTLFGWQGSGQLLDHRADFELKEFGNPILTNLFGDIGRIGQRGLAISGQGGTAGGTLLSVITASPWLKLVGVLAEGDGVVPTFSATAGGRLASDFCLAVHTGSIYAALDGCVQPTWEHLTGFRGAAAGAAAARVLEEDAPVPLGEVAGSSLTIAPDPITGKATVEDTVTVEAGAPWGFFHTLWPDADSVLRFTLVTPSGQEITPQNVSLLGGLFDLSADLGATRGLYVVPAPEAGEWVLRLSTTEDTPAYGTAARLTTHTHSTVALEARASPARVEPGEAALVTARLSGAVQGLAIEATAQPANVTLALHDDGRDGDAVAGDGLWSARHTDTSESGAHTFDVRATGTLGGSDLVRTARAGLHVAATEDIRVRDLRVDPGLAWWGETVTARAVVENVGKASSRVTVVWSEDSDANEVSPVPVTQDLGPLAVGESRAVEFLFLPSKGLRTVQVEAYLDGLEERLDDNQARASFEVIPTPRTAARFEGPQGQAGWHLGPVRVSLVPFDGTPAPYLGTSYSLDGGALEPYTGPFSVAAEGLHLLAFRSVDPAGLEEPLRTAAFGIDSLPPSAAIAAPDGAAVSTLDQRVAAPVKLPVVAGLVDVDLRSDDAVSGVKRLQVRVDGLLHATFDDPPAQVVWRWDSTTTSSGRHTLALHATDHAGHVATAAREVYVTASRTIQVENDPKATVARLTPPVV